MFIWLSMIYFLNVALISAAIDFTVSNTAGSNFPALKVAKASGALDSKVVKKISSNSLTLSTGTSFNRPFVPK